MRRQLSGAVLSALVQQYHPEAQKYLDFAKDKVEEDTAAIAKAEEEYIAEKARIKADAEKAAEERAKKLAEKEKETLLAMDKEDQEKYHKEKAARRKREKEAKEKREAQAEAAEAEEKRLAEKPAQFLPETSTYVTLLIVLWLLDLKRNGEAAQVSAQLVQTTEAHNRRTLDLLSEKVYFYYSLAHERIGQLQSVRQPLLFAHRTACLQHNEPAQSMLTALILRNYLHYNHISQADKFRLNVAFPASSSNDVHARYLYYLGKIHTVQLHYSEAYANLSQALRKAPQTAAVGFRQQANKLLVIVQLLMGDIPERQVFRQKGLARSLQPYFKLAQSVRVGDLAAFQTLMQEHKESFTRDGLVSLIIRLRHNVIKTGLRKINLAYSRISMADICTKLSLDSEEDAEYIVAKAVHDGVIDAVIDRENSCVVSKEHVDVYSSHEPQDVFNKRIQFCMDLRNETVRAMRFPKNAHKPQNQMGEGEGGGDNEEKKDSDEALDVEDDDEDDPIDGGL